MIVQTQPHGLHVVLRQPISHLWNLLLWLCLTFRQAKPGKVCLSTAHIDGKNVTIQDLTLARIPESTDCWSPLFETAIIAMDPRIVSEPEIFLGTGFDIMLQLAGVEYPMMVDGGLVLMGYSTALVPVKEVDHQTVLWHLETAGHDFQLKPKELSAIKGKWLKKTNWEILQSKRVLLGWCPEAITLLGTGDSGSTVGWFNTKLKQSTWNWKGANLQFTATTASPLQIGGQAGVTFERSINTLRFNAARNYRKCLTTSLTEQVVLYDVTESRAWLVPLICVFHEMLLAYRQRIPSGYRKDDFPLATPASNGALASFAALSDNGQYVIEGSGQDQLTIRELILGFSVNLSKTSLQGPGWSNRIYGYELMDIVMDSPKSELKRSRIKKEGLGWTPLLSQVNCLFCSSLGDAIVGLKATQISPPAMNFPRGLTGWPHLCTASMP